MPAERLNRFDVLKSVVEVIQRTVLRPRPRRFGTRTVNAGLSGVKGFLSRLGAMGALVAAVLCGAPRIADAQTLIAAAVPTQVRSGQAVTISGHAVGAIAGSVADLYASSYPYPVRRLLATAPVSASGTFSFNVRPDRDTRYVVTLAGTTARATTTVAVTDLVFTKVRALSLGRAGATIVVFHPRDLRWGGAVVRWSFASPAGRAFRAVPSTRAFALSPYVVILRTSVALPAGSFRFRACFHAAGDHALANPRRPSGCTGRGYYGGGRLPSGFPGPNAIAKASSYLSARIGRTAFAVVDSEGRLSGLHVHWQFPTASVVKAMLLTAYLRRLDAMGQHHIDSFSNSFLYPMIHVSDNQAATRCWSIVGDAGLYTVAKAAAMTEFSVSGPWLTALLSPADQARFFFAMDSLIPREFVGYARFLLSTIEASQSWGIPVVARPLGYQTFFKDGSEPTALGQLVHQVDRLEGHGRVFSTAVMTDGDPTMQYGIDTIQGVATALLR